MKAFYNEIDPYCCKWLSNLMDAGLITPGKIDDRPIQELSPNNLIGYERAHFFAGIGGWDIALNLAEWGSRPVWSGSCPCQPFSAAGAGKAANDERHLWPEWYRLIKACGPARLFGEQVASAAVVGKQGATSPIFGGGEEAESSLSLDTSRAGPSEEEELALRSGLLREGNPTQDRLRHLRGNGLALELGGWPDLGQPIVGSDRSQGTLSLFEHSGGLPRDQQRNGGLGRAATGEISLGDLGAEAGEVERIIEAIGREFGPTTEWPWLDLIQFDLERAGYTIGPCVLPACGVGAPHIRQRLWFVADAEKRDQRGHGGIPRDATDARQSQTRQTNGYTARGSSPMGYANSAGRVRLPEQDQRPEAGRQTSRRPNAQRSDFWNDVDWLECADGRARPVEPGTFPLAHGIPARVDKLRAYGNAIVPQIAAEFIRATQS